MVNFLFFCFAKLIMVNDSARAQDSQDKWKFWNLDYGVRTAGPRNKFWRNKESSSSYYYYFFSLIKKKKKKLVLFFSFCLFPLFILVFIQN
jgi:hypothetical protein